MFVDVRELKPGGVESFKRKLASLQERPQNPATTEPSAPGVHRAPPRAYFPGIFTSSNPGVPLAPGNQDIESPENVILQSDPQTRNGLELEEGQSRYLLLCINTRTLPTLHHIDFMDIYDGQSLFASIRDKYWRMIEHHCGILA